VAGVRCICKTCRTLRDMPHFFSYLYGTVSCHTLHDPRTSLLRIFLYSATSVCLAAGTSMCHADTGIRKAMRGCLCATTC